MAWCEGAYYLPERPRFTLDPLLHAGAYYVQEASSMFVGQAVKQYVKQPVKCLDLCAAPGGKSTLLLDALPERSLVVSNEVIRSRCQILSENCIKWGSPFSIVTNNDPADFAKLQGLFDIVVADVPCSGEGMFRKDPESRKHWTLENVKLCASRSRRIIQDCWATLKPGGLLLYSTCTYNKEENEENITHFMQTLGAEPLEIDLDPAWGISPAVHADIPAYRFFPHMMQGEGFFMALLRKPIDALPPSKMSPAKKKMKASKQQPIPQLFKDWIKSGKTVYSFEQKGSDYIAIPLLYKDTYELIRDNLRILSCGVTLGQVKGKDTYVPAHALALSTEIAPAAFPICELSLEDALTYLRKEVLLLPDEYPKGYVLVKYKGHALGFVKQIGSRANNLYPDAWRIRYS